MTRTVTKVDEIDLEIAVAYIALGAARSAEAHCPSGENARLVAVAEAAVDELLDARLAAARGAGTITRRPAAGPAAA